MVFDEFQDVLAAQERADAIIRSEIQHHGDSASYVFSGSHLGMMRELFGDRRRAFYGQAGSVELPPLPPDEVAGYIAECFERTGRSVGGALDPLLAASDGHPQRTMLLAHAVWERTPSGQTANEATWAGAEDAVARNSRRAARDLDIAEAQPSARPCRRRRQHSTPLCVGSTPRRLARRSGAQRRESARGPRRDRPG